MVASLFKSARLSSFLLTDTATSDYQIISAWSNASELIEYFNVTEDSLLALTSAPSTRPEEMSIKVLSHNVAFGVCILRANVLGVRSCSADA